MVREGEINSIALCLLTLKSFCKPELHDCKSFIYLPSWWNLANKWIFAGFDVPENGRLEKLENLPVMIPVNPPLTGGKVASPPCAKILNNVKWRRVHIYLLGSPFYTCKNGGHSKNILVMLIFWWSYPQFRWRSLKCSEIPKKKSTFGENCKWQTLKTRIMVSSVKLIPRILKIWIFDT